MQAGGSVKMFGLDYNVQSPYGNDTPYSVLPGLDPFVLSSRDRAGQTGAYLQATRSVASRIDLTVGGRFDRGRRNDRGSRAGFRRAR